jgi:hypothetical protein
VGNRGTLRPRVCWCEIDDIRPLENGSEKIQCIEIHGNKNSRLLVISVYLPAKGSKNHVTEFQECIDEIYELIQKYGNTHKILIGDLNEDLNNASGSKRNNYLREFINEGQLKFNMSKTFTNANGIVSIVFPYSIFCSHNSKR